MNGFDIALLVIIGLAVTLGLLKGLVRLLIGLGALIAAFLLASQLHGPLAAEASWMDIPQPVLNLVAYLIVFIGTMLVGALVAYLLRRLLRAAMLGWADRLAGGAIGLVVATLVAALLVLPLVAYSPFGERALRDSVLAPYVTVVADLANQIVPQELSDNYRNKVEDLRRYWRERWEAAETS